MPTYEYVCTECGHHLEVVQSFTDDSLTTCPNCGGALRKVFGNIGIVLKGSGFYKNDSRPAPKSGGDTKAKPAAAAEGGSSDATATTPAPTTKTPDAASTSSTPAASGTPSS